jgi:hypothetical protein
MEQRTEVFVGIDVAKMRNAIALAFLSSEGRQGSP